MAAFLVLHGAEHNANFNHSDGNDGEPRDGQTLSNATIMGSGNYVHRKGINNVIQKGSNSAYINAMNKHFGGKPAQDNYNYNKRRSNGKVIHY